MIRDAATKKHPAAGSPAACLHRHRAKQRLITLPLFLAICLTVRSQHGYWQQQVDVKIDVSLNDRDHTLEAFEKIEYTNHSPDTLTYIWFHLWPNAFKNDQTAFSDQMLENGRTDFYFSDKDQRGYINRLDFRVNGQTAALQDHPEYIDIVKLILPQPLQPGQSIEITTPFHEKLPENFSRGGHVGQSYQITQWYPKPAVYDARGWHPMPYLNQGEFYSEFGNFDVRITLPSDYVVAATGELQNEEEKSWLFARTLLSSEPDDKETKPAQKNTSAKTNPYAQPQQSSATEKMKTIEFKQDRVHDFAWFADKRFVVRIDTLQLSSGRAISLYSFFLPRKKTPWEKSLLFAKNAVSFYSDHIGEYPYHVISIVEAEIGFGGGMEYPTIASISTGQKEEQLSEVILHEVGHNWFYGILASDERRFAWMDEGINTYYVNRYKAQAAEQTLKTPGGIPDPGVPAVYIEALEKKKSDQPVNTPSDQFSSLNYSLIPYYKAGSWLKQIQESAGMVAFDRAMQGYFQQWAFKHPYPDDFKSSLEQGTGTSWEQSFELLSKTGPLSNTPERKKWKLALVYPIRESVKYNYLSLAPAVGYNVYDQLMAGLLVHNYQISPTRLQFLAAPVYATASKQINGLATMHYSWYPGNNFKKISIGLSGGRFSSLSGTDSNGAKVFGGFYKIVPSLRMSLQNRSPRSSLEKWIEFKTFVIGEKGFTYSQKSSDSIYYPSSQPYSTHYINQLTFNIENYRALYPYQAALQVQQGRDFYRINFTGNYFFNYAKGGGLNMRLFAAKFGYIGGMTTSKQFETTVYQPKLTASRGEDDYTYSNYFIGRNESTGFPSQQIMMKDGGLKLRTDLFQDLQGRSDKWVTSLNINTSLPNKLFPAWLPIKLFFDVGTYADAWSSDPPTSRFLYVGGIQLSLLKNTINIYVPVFYSHDFSNSLKTVPEENTFWKKISFSIDVQNIIFRRIFKNIP